MAVVPGLERIDDLVAVLHRTDQPGKEVHFITEVELEPLGREPQPEDEVGPAPPPDPVDDLEQDARAVLNRAAVAILAAVHGRA